MKKYAALLIGLAATLLMANLKSDLGLSEDTAHYISGAVNLTTGNGYATDIINYDRYHLAGKLPAIQTVWPPGMSILVAAARPIATTYSIAVMWVGYLALLFTAFFLFRQLQINGIPPIYSIATCLLFLCTLEFWDLASRGSSTIPMIAFCLGVLYFVQRADDDGSSRLSTRNLLLAGVFAACAFLMHYTALFFLAGVGIYTLFWFRDRSFLATVQRQIILWSIPVLTIGAIFVRLFMYSGDVSDRPGGKDGADTVEIIRHFVWSFGDITGLSPEYLIELRPYTILGFLGVFGLLLIFSTRIYRCKSVAQLVAAGFKNRALLIYAIPFIAICASFTAYAFIHGANYITGRYLLICLPIGLLLLAVAIRSVIVESRRAEIVAAICLVCIAGAQVEIAKRVSSIEAMQERAIITDAALASEVCDRPLHEWLNQTADHRNPVLVNNGQLFWLRSRIPTLTFAPRTYSSTIWSTDAAKTTIERFNVRYVIVLRRLLDIHAPGADDRLFFHDLETLQIPSWLTPVVTNDDLLVFEFADWNPVGVSEQSISSCLARTP